MFRGDISTFKNHFIHYYDCLSSRLLNIMRNIHLPVIFVFQEGFGPLNFMWNLVV